MTAGNYDPANWYWLMKSGEIYSSKNSSVIKGDDEDYLGWLKSGNLATNIESMADLIVVLREANVPPYHLVPTRLIVDRLQSAGKLDAANAALDAADPYTRQRWNTRTYIYADDPTANALIKAIGGKPEEILAPE